jgi:hypothetical protein
MGALNPKLSTTGITSASCFAKAEGSDGSTLETPTDIVRQAG